MGAFRRVAGTIALCALLVAGAAGLSGHLMLENCFMSGPGLVEGTRTESGHRWWPPGYECRYSLSDGWTAYAPDASSVVAGGSVPAFLATLLAGALLWLLVARARPHVNAPLRLTAATALAFAAVGIGALYAGLRFGLLTGWVLGVPLAFLADRRLQAGRSALAGLTGAAVAAFAVLAAGFGFLFDLGLGAFAIVLGAVALLAARPRRRPLTLARPG